jgi:hypothetical protein
VIKGVGRVGAVCARVRPLSKDARPEAVFGDAFGLELSFVDLVIERHQ